MGAAPHTRRNLLAFVGPELVWGFAWALSFDGTMPSAFGDSFGGDDTFVGLAWGLIGLGLALPMLFTQWIVLPLRRRAGFVFWMHVAAGLVWLLLALSVHLLGDSAPEAQRACYLVLLFVFFLLIGVQAPAWFGLVGDLFPAGQRARVLGIAFLVNRVGTFAGGACVRSVLGSSRTPSEQWSLLFLVGGVVAVLACLPYLWLVEPERKPQQRPPLRVHLRAMAGVWRREGTLRRFILADALAVASFVLLAFYAQSAFDRDGFERAWSGTWTQIGAVSMLLSSMAVAVYGPRVLPRTWLLAAVGIAIVGAIAAAVGGSSLMYGTAAATCGACVGIRMACHSPEVMRLAPSQDPAASMGVAGTAATAVQGLLPVIAGLAAASVGYVPVFLGTGVLMGLGAALLIAWVPWHPPSPGAVARK